MEKLFFNYSSSPLEFYNSLVKLSLQMIKENKRVKYTPEEIETFKIYKPAFLDFFYLNNTEENSEKEIACSVFTFLYLLKLELSDLIVGLVYFSKVVERFKLSISKRIVKK